jgi:hypothetical protein
MLVKIAFFATGVTLAQICARQHTSQMMIYKKLYYQLNYSCRKAIRVIPLYSVQQNNCHHEQTEAFNEDIINAVSIS